MPDIKSPAVKSLEDDEKTKRDQPDVLDVGLEGTFPGSDPVSATTTATTGAVEPGSDDPDVDQATVAPLVDEALEAVATQHDDTYSEAREGVAALKGEIESVAYRGATMADNVRDRVCERPMQAVGLATLIGFFWGMSHSRR